VNVINNTSLTRDQINGWALDFTRTEFEKFEALKRAVALAPELRITLGQEVVDQAITRRKLIRSITDDRYLLVQAGFDEFLEARGIRLDRLAATYCEVTKALAVGQLEAIDLMARGASPLPTQSIATNKPALLVSVAADPPAPAKHSKTIADLIEPYMRERHRGGISDSYARDIRTAMAWFSKWFGSSRTVSGLTPEEIRDFKDGLLLLPANWSKKLKALTIREAAKLNEDGHLPKLEVQALNSKRWISTDRQAYEGNSLQDQQDELRAFTDQLRLTLHALHKEVGSFGPSFIPRLDHLDLAWRIGSIFNPVTFRWSQFQANWPGMMLSKDGAVLSVGTLHTDPPLQPVFIRPDADSKTFDGGVRSRPELDALLSGLDADLQVVTASPSPIDAEYRIFMIASEVVAASEYRRNGQPSIQGLRSSQRAIRMTSLQRARPYSKASVPIV
jgi:hypothetical protein